MEDKSKILKEETEKLLAGVEKIENVFSKLKQNPIVELAGAANFFTLRATECGVLVVNCTTALAALPLVTPITSKIQRSQYREVRSRLKSLISSFLELQLNLNILIPLISPQRILTTAEQGVKATNLAAITLKIPGVLTDMVFAKLECLKIKDAMDL